MRVNGFFGHIQQNHFRSMVMFSGFMLSMHIAIATILSIPFPFWRDIPAVFDDPIGYVKTMWLWVTAFNFLVFTLFYYGQSYFLKLTIGFKPLTPNSCPRVYAITQNLAGVAGIPVPQIDYIPSPALNSFATGLTKNSAHIVITQGLLDALDDDELAAVIAHEIAHIKNGDMHMMAVANAAIGSIKSINLINPMKFSFVKRIPPLGLFLGLPILLPVLILAAFYSFVMQLTSLIANATRYVISSSREYIADAEAVRLTHNPAALVSALSKIHGRSDIHCKNAIANAMMIDGPTTGKDASHPTIKTRIDKLAQLSGSMIYGSGVRKDTRARSLQAYNGDAYGAQAYRGQSTGAPTFAQGFGRRPVNPSIIHDVIPSSADYAAYQGPAYRPDESGSVFDRVSEGNDGEYGLGKTARWVIIILLSVYAGNTLLTKARKAKEPKRISYSKIIKRSPAYVTLDLKGSGLWTVGQYQSKAYLNIHDKEKKHRTGWLGSGAGFLFHDRNRNKRLDGLEEVVQMDLEQAQRSSNFYMLKKFDDNGDGFIDKRDREFSQFMVWQDYGKDGIYESNEGKTLSELGIARLNLSASAFKNADGAEQLKGRVIASKALLIRQGTFTRDETRTQRSLIDGTEGKLFMTSFEIDVSRYKAENGEIIIDKPETEAKPETQPTSVKSAKLSQNTSKDLKPPQLRR